ncbi:efflux RND transporter periplasmic adaptor subunit [Larkinella rosea]|uniref:Efflux RND transporter periplasmic adaptor subunit n=1 Tax=Larkinella rosea TaxID=2025312 RepID=A0A3P1BNY5_9BACT|nr:efflux RND transporter periplasmic adaptor subunit [Larkinella rosea]RRB02779.1 efflux RND transporter periplasmic adaptor subunit [Larkinella rosea]
MKKVLVILTILAVIGATTALLMSNKQKQQQQIQEAQKPLATTVALETVRKESFTEAVSYLGKTEFWREIRMNATTQGTIRSLSAQLYETVREGQPVITVDTELTEIAMAQAEAQLHKAQTDLKRYETLHRENNIPTAEVENARLQVRTIESQLLTLKKQLRDAVVYTPIGGVVTEKPIERGMFIAPGSPLLTITDVSSVKVVANVPEADLSLFQPGRNVAVAFDMYPGKKLSGTVHQIRLKGGETGTFPVEIRVPNSSANPLRVGMTASISLPNASPLAGLAIPRTALVTTSQHPAVFVLQDKKVSLRTIEPGSTSGTTLFVRSGLREGERVVVSGTESLKDGQIVAIQE